MMLNVIFIITMMGTMIKTTTMVMVTKRWLT